MALGKIFKIPSQSVPFLLNYLILAVVVPVGVALGVLGWTTYQDKRNNITQHMMETTRFFSAVMDEKIYGVLLSMQTLASSPSLIREDYSSFYSQTKTILVNHPNADIIVADAKGQQLVNSYLPQGSPLPMRNVSDRVRHVFETGEPSISNTFKGAVTSRLLISVDVPVMRDGRVISDLAMTIPVDDLLKVLAFPSLPPEWTATILDGDNTVLARTQDQERFIGKQTEMPVLTEHKKVAQEGVIRATSLTGIPVLAGYHQSSTSGWTMVISVPESYIRRDLWRWLTWTLAGIALLGSLSAGIALRLGNKITRSIKSLTILASALGRGEAVNDDNLELTEIQAVGRSLADASKLLKQREAELRESEAKYSSFFTYSHDGLLLTSPDGRIHQANPAACRLLGRSEEELRQGGRKMLFDENDPAIQRHLKVRAEQGSAAFEVSHKRKDGSVILVEAASNIYLDDRGEKRACVVMRDITERKRAEELHQEIERSIRHNLRIPACNAIQLARILRTDGNMTNEQLRMLDLFQQAGVNMLDTLDTSLTLYKIETGQYQAQPESIDCLASISELIEALKRKVRFANVHLIVQVNEQDQPPDSCRFCRCEPKLFLIALQNLLVNALEASPPDAEVVVEFSSDQGFTIEIKNHGVVPKNIRDRFFEKYVTQDKKNGTGLGTYSAKMMVEAQGGSIEMRTSDEDNETVVTVRMPI